MTAPAEFDPQPVRRHLRVGEIGFSYCEAGAGPPLVLLHGIGSSAESWRDQLADLADLRHVLAWDAPGYGTSTPLDQARPSPADYADRLALLLDTLGLECIALAGHSLGALIAGAFAAARPGRVERLILADAARGHGTDPSAPLPPGAQARLDDLAALGPAEFARRRAPRLLSAAATPSHLSRVRETMARIPPAGYRQAVAMLAQADLYTHASSLISPTMVLCGSEDTVTPPDTNRSLAAAIAGARYVELPGAGHASYVEQPASFNAAVRAFLGAP